MATTTTTPPRPGSEAERQAILAHYRANVDKFRGDLAAARRDLMAQWYRGRHPGVARQRYAEADDNDVQQQGKAEAHISALLHLCRDGVATLADDTRHDLDRALRELRGEGK